MDHRHGFGYRRPQPLRQLRNRDTPARVKFCIAVANVRVASHTRNDPLPHVAAQVQHQVADGVFVLSAARPDLLYGELVQAGLNARGHLFQLARREVENLGVE